MQNFNLADVQEIRLVFGWPSADSEDGATEVCHNGAQMKALDGIYSV